MRLNVVVRLVLDTAESPNLNLLLADIEGGPVHASNGAGPCGVVDSVELVSAEVVA